MNKFKGIIVALMAVTMVFAFSACKSGDDTSSLIEEDLTVFPEGTSISGENISGKTLDEAKEVAKNHIDKSIEETEISVKFTDDTISLKGTDFVATDIVDLELPKLFEKRVSGDYQIPYVIDLSDTGKQKIMEASKNSFASGKNATVVGYNSDIGGFEFSEGEKGRRANVDKTMQNIRELLSKKNGGALQAAFMEISPKIAKSELESKFTKLSSYSTVSSNTANGNSNMALAMRNLSGTVLEPGDVFSYNNSIGNSTSTDAGYLPAGGIISGVLVDVIGGGICQTSSTLYNSVIRAGLEITSRECHSMESSYVPTGLDATVDYGNIDFQFRNNLEYPVYLTGWMDGTTLYSEIYGVFPDEWDTIEVASWREGTYEPLGTVSFVTDHNMAQGEYKLRTSGNTGVSSAASRSFYKNGELVRTESLPSSYYPPTGKIFAVGPGTDTSKIDPNSGGGGGNTDPTPTPAPNPDPTPAPDPDPDPTPDPDPDPTENPDPDPDSDE